MSLSTSISDLATRLATEFKSVRADMALDGHTHNYSPTGHTHSEFPTLVESSSASDFTVAAPITGLTNRAVQRFAYLANGADINISFSASIRTSTGVTRGPYLVPNGEVLLAAMEYSTLINAWVLTAVTVSAV